VSGKDVRVSKAKRVLYTDEKSRNKREDVSSIVYRQRILLLLKRHIIKT